VHLGRCYRLCLKFLETLFKLTFSGESLFLFDFSCSILIINMHNLPMNCAVSGFRDGLGSSKGLRVDPILGTIDQPTTRLPKVLPLYSANDLVVVDRLEFGRVLS
jgi:hypothetical protein